MPHEFRNWARPYVSPKIASWRDGGRRVPGVIFWAPGVPTPLMHLTAKEARSYAAHLLQLADQLDQNKKHADARAARRAAKNKNGETR